MSSSLPPPTIIIDPTTQLTNHPNAPICNSEVDTCVDDEVSIILHSLDSYTQETSSFSNSALVFTKSDPILHTNISTFVQDTSMEVKTNDLDKIRELKANGTRVLVKNDVNSRVEWLIAWRCKTNEKRRLEEKNANSRVHWLLDWLVGIYFPP